YESPRLSVDHGIGHRSGPHAAALTREPLIGVLSAVLGKVREIESVAERRVRPSPLGRVVQVGAFRYRPLQPRRAKRTLLQALRPKLGEHFTVHDLGRGSTAENELPVLLRRGSSRGPERF